MLGTPTPDWPLCSFLGREKPEKIPGFCLLSKSLT